MMKIQILKSNKFNKEKIKFIKKSNKNKNVNIKDAGTIYTNIVSTLPYLNKKYHFNRFLTTTFLPVTITNDKKAITTLQTDYIFWTKTLATIIESALTKIKGNANNFELVIRGKISKRTLDELSKRNIKVLILKIC